MFLTFFIKTVSAFFCFIWNNILSRKTRKSDWCFFLHFLCFFSLISSSLIVSMVDK